MTEQPPAEAPLVLLRPTAGEDRQAFARRLWEALVAAGTAPQTPEGSARPPGPGVPDEDDSG